MAKPLLDFGTVTVGEELGPLDYELSAEKMELYRRAVSDPDAAYPTIASKDYAVLLRTRYDLGRIVNAKHESQYSMPPRVGGRIETRGRVTDKYRKRDNSFIVVETVSTDEAGAELVRSRTTLMLGKPKEAA